MTYLPTYLKHHLVHKGGAKILTARKTWKKTYDVFSIRIVPADSLALLGARTSAGTVMTNFTSMSIWEPSISLMPSPSIYSTDWWMYPKDGTVLPRWTNNNLFLLEIFCCHGILSWKQSVYFLTKMLRRNGARTSGLEYVNVYVCKRVLFWCVFPKMLSNKGHSHELTNSFSWQFSLVLKHQDISIYNAEYAPVCFQLFMG